jgi:hypothetical protein
LFVTGKRYLLLIGGSPDTKQYERVDSASDRWLAFVAKQTRDAARP